MRGKSSNSLKRYVNPVFIYVTYYSSISHLRYLASCTDGLLFIIRVRINRCRFETDIFLTGHEVAKDFKSYMTDLQVRLQRVRIHFLNIEAHEFDSFIVP